MNIGKELAEALKLPENTIGFNLRVYAGEWPTVTIELFPDNESGAALASVFRRYEIVDASDKTEAA